MYFVLAILSLPVLSISLVRAAEPAAPVDSPFDKQDIEIQKLKALKWKDLDPTAQDLRTQCTTMLAMTRILDLLGGKADARAEMLSDYIEEQRLGETFGRSSPRFPSRCRSPSSMRRISLAFIKSPLGVAKFSDEFGGSDDGVLKGYLMLYAKTALREFAEVVEARHGVRAMSLFLEKQGKLAEFEKWSSAEHKCRQEAMNSSARRSGNKQQPVRQPAMTRPTPAFAAVWNRKKLSDKW